MNPDNMNQTKWQANLWQDIDTVPKDGRVVLLSDGTTVVAAYWYEAVNPKWPPRAGWVLAGGDDMCGVLDLLDSGYYDWFAPAGFTPTHWMPMLELPGV